MRFRLLCPLTLLRTMHMGSVERVAYQLSKGVADMHLGPLVTSVSRAI